MQIQIQIDFRSGTPIYVQITEQIRRQLAEGKLKPGDQLPTVREMAADLRVNYNTIARAYRLLDEAGLISTQQGRGTYIWSEETQFEPRTDLEELTRRFFEQVRQMAYSKADVTAVFERLLVEWSEAEASKDKKER